MISNEKNFDVIISSYILNEFEFVEQSITSFNENDEYDINNVFFRIVNDFIKRQNYFINITNIEKTRENVKNKIYFQCNRNKSFKNDNVDKRNIVSKRIECFFKTLDVFIVNDKWTLKRIVDSKYNHDRDVENDYIKIREYFMTFVVRKNIKQ